MRAVQAAPEDSRSSCSYDAFISYNRTADERLAPEVQRGLRRLTRAWYQRQALSVFLDKESLEDYLKVLSLIAAPA